MKKKQNNNHGFKIIPQFCNVSTSPSITAGTLESAIQFSAVSFTSVCVTHSNTQPFTLEEKETEILDI